MKIVSVTYASSPSSDLLISTLGFNNDIAGVIRLIFQRSLSINSNAPPVVLSFDSTLESNQGSTADFGSSSFLLQSELQMLLLWINMQLIAG